MSASLNNPHLSRSKYKNWIKAGLGVLYTKEGIEPFAYDEIEQFQQKCLSDICNNNGVPSGTVCSSCCTENVVVCPTNRICNVGRGECKFHQTTAKQYLSSGCPNKICHNFKNEIQKAHRYYGPSYKNTDAKQWCSNPWEVAKCFMPPDGYNDVTSAAETDFNGIISVIINYKAFQSKVKDDISKKENIFEQGRVVGRTLRHSTQLDDKDMKKYFTDLQNLLSDPAYLSTNIAAQDAKTKLIQLQNDTLIIGKDDISNVLDGVVNTVQDKVSTVITEADKKLIDITKEYVNDIEGKGKVSIDQLDTVLNSAIDKLEKQTQESVEKIQAEANTAKKQIKECADEEAKKLQVNAEAAATKFAANTDEVLKKMEESTTKIKEDKYNKFKAEFKEDLTEFYKTIYSTISLSPLIEEHETPLVDIYVLPEMNLIEKQKGPAGEETKIPVESLSDVFKSESSREIYLSADAGFGKTAFSKYLAITWCQAHHPDEKYNDYFSEDVVNTMREFDYLFLVLLRDSSDNCSIDDLILNQVIKDVSRPYSMESLQEILHREKCLVILDGLDEWTHPEKKCTRVPKTIPHRNARKNCVILTTTRPWKLGVLNLKASELGKKVELVKLTSKSAQILEERAISKMKNLDVTEAKFLAQQMHAKIKENKLEDLESVPLLTMYLICLWCEGITLGQSKCKLYSQIVELLLSRAISKNPEMEKTCEPSQSEVPLCFSEQEYCTNYGAYLKALGQLAFETLFSETKVCSLVFNKSVTDKYLSPKYFQLSLDTGLLTQSTERTLLKRISKCSFSHKIVQEFFCALYISCQNESDVKDIVLKNCKSLQSILDMSTVFVFISGMVNAEIISSISRELKPVIDADEITSKYRSNRPTTNYRCEPLDNVQRMFVSCMKENPESRSKLFCQDFFFNRDCEEENYFTYLKQLLVDNKNNMMSINILTLDGGPCLLREIIASGELIDRKSIDTIVYRGRGEDDQLPILLNRPTKYLTVISFGAIILRKNFLLQTIKIHDYKMSHDLLHKFVNFINNSKQLTRIYLTELSCSEHENQASAHKPSKQ